MWQEGYGASSIGMAQVAATLSYIAHQREHHEKVDFQAEFLAFLKKHRIEFDRPYGAGQAERGSCPRVPSRQAGTPPWAIFDPPSGRKQ